MDYHIRPLDTKHAVVLPVGQEAEFKIKKDRLFLKVPDGDKKTRPYQVVSMQPVDSSSKTEATAYRSAEKPAEPRTTTAGTDKVTTNNNDKLTNETTTGRPPQR
jgi:hypothetical protein